jgi:SAM-dependent methyltransferase
VAHNTARRFGIIGGQIDDPYGAARSDSEIPGTLASLNNTFARYLDYGKLTPATLAGAHVLEVGPGNTIGIPLLFRAAGAARAAAIDKFVPLQDTPFHHHLYAQMREGLDADGRKRVDAAIKIGDRVELIPPHMEYVTGRGIEDAPFPPQSFDLVVSNAVLMEVYDADAMFEALDRVLKPGGRMVHTIDLRDYSMFPKRGFHHLEFLTIPDGIYRNMAESIGQPNRRLVDYYRDKMASLGYEATIYITWITGAKEGLAVPQVAIRHGVDYGDEAVAMVREIRPRLLARYRTLSDEDMLTGGILLVAQKPAGS